MCWHQPVWSAASASADQPIRTEQLPCPHPSASWLFMANFRDAGYHELPYYRSCVQQRPVREHAGTELLQRCVVTGTQHPVAVRINRWKVAAEL